MPKIPSVWFDSQATFIRGKYKGMDVYDVASDDPSYLSWMRENVDSLTREDEDLIEEALDSSARGRGTGLRGDPQ